MVVRYMVFAPVIFVMGCTTFAPNRVSDDVIGGCVRKSGFPDGTQYSVEEVFRTDGLDRRVVRSPDISEDQAYEINKCIQASFAGGPAAPAVAVQTSRPPRVGAQCASGQGVFSGGTGYCR